MEKFHSSSWNHRCQWRTFIFKGLVHPKMKFLSLITNPDVVPHPWDLFIFRTQIKIFLIKSGRFFIPHRKEHNYRHSKSRKVVKTFLKQSTWLQWFNLNVMKWLEYLKVQYVRILQYNIQKPLGQCYIFCSLEYLQYPKCFQLFVNREKIAILTKAPGRVRSCLSIAPYPHYPRFPVLFCKNHGNTKDALIYYIF